MFTISLKKKQQKKKFKLAQKNLCQFEPQAGFCHALMLLNCKPRHTREGVVAITEDVKLFDNSFLGSH